MFDERHVLGVNNHGEAQILLAPACNKIFRIVALLIRITIRHISRSTCGQLSQPDCSQQGDQMLPVDQDPYVFYPVPIETASLPGTTRRSNWSRRLENAPSTSLAIQRRRRICFSSCPWHFKGETRFLFKVPWLRAKALQSVITAMHALHANRSSHEKAVRLSVRLSICQTRGL